MAAQLLAKGPYLYTMDAQYQPAVYLYLGGGAFVCYVQLWASKGEGFGIDKRLRVVCQVYSDVLPNRDTCQALTQLPMK